MIACGLPTNEHTASIYTAEVSHVKLTICPCLHRPFVSLHSALVNLLHQFKIAKILLSLIVPVYFLSVPPRPTSSSDNSNYSKF